MGKAGLGVSDRVILRALGMVLLRWVVLPAVALVAAGVVLSALAHGEAHWIQSERMFVDRTGTHCCGSSDCFPVVSQELYEEQDGVTFEGQKLFYSERGIYWTREPNPEGKSRPFVCRRLGKVKCIFREQPGM